MAWYACAWRGHCKEKKLCWLSQSKLLIKFSHEMILIVLRAPNKWCVKYVHLSSIPIILLSVVTLGLQLMCSKLLPIILLEFSPIILLCLFQNGSQKIYTCIRNTSFKIIESNEVKPLVLAANCKLYRYTIRVSEHSIYINLS